MAVDSWIGEHRCWEGRSDQRGRRGFHILGFFLTVSTTIFQRKRLISHFSLVVMPECSKFEGHYTDCTHELQFTWRSSACGSSYVSAFHGCAVWELTLGATTNISIFTIMSHNHSLTNIDSPASIIGLCFRTDGCWSQSQQALGVAPEQITSLSHLWSV